MVAFRIVEWVVLLGCLIMSPFMNTLNTDGLWTLCLCRYWNLFCKFNEWPNVELVKVLKFETFVNCSIKKVHRRLRLQKQIWDACNNNCQFEKKNSYFCMLGLKKLKQLSWYLPWKIILLALRICVTMCCVILCIRMSQFFELKLHPCLLQWFDCRTFRQMLLLFT